MGILKCRKRNWGNTSKIKFSVFEGTWSHAKSYTNKVMEIQSLVQGRCRKWHETCMEGLEVGAREGGGVAWACKALVRVPLPQWAFT